MPTMPQKQKQPWILLLVGDLHVNSTVGLCPPVVHLDDGGRYKFSPYQRFIWAHWLTLMDEVAQVRKELGYRVMSVINGELADNNYHATTQLITRNPADQVKMAVRTLQPLLEVTDDVVVLRGTEAHSGPSAAFDEEVAQELNAIQTPDENYSWFHWMADLGGWSIDVAHHPGHGHSRPWTRGGDANRLAADIMYRYAEQGMKPPDLVVRGHVHKPVDSYDNHPTRAVVLPSWQLNTSFGHRIGGGWLPIGGGYVILHGDRSWELVKRFARWPVKRNVWKPHLQRTS